MIRSGFGMNSNGPISLFFFFLLINTNDARIVRLSNGLIDGVHFNDTGQDTNVFLGVPYARPPLGSLRFQKAQSNWRWFGIQNTTGYAPACVGTSEVNKNRQKESEDCLYLDVYADGRCWNQTNCTVVFLLSALPVHVPKSFNFTTIPGVAGNPSGGLIVVVPAYRQNIFGFADFGQTTSDAPSNLGLYDILHALKWTKREIGAFGGNPHRIVLVEDPSAAPLGQLLVTSPVLDDDLLAGAAILHQKLPLVEEHTAQNATERVLERVGCLDSSDSGTQWWWNSENVRDKIRCLREKPVEELAAAGGHSERAAFGPQVDGNIVAVETLAGIIGNIKPINLLLISPMEESVRTNGKLEEECEKYVRLFGYSSSNGVQSCVRHYAPRIDGVSYIRNDVLNSIATEVGMLTAAENSSTYLGFTALPEYPQRSIDFFINTTKRATEWTAANGTAQVAPPTGHEERMHGYYSRFFTHLLHEFIRNGSVEHDWQPVNLDGANHYFITFQLEADNTTLKYAPTFYPTVYNQRAVRFWLKELPEAEAEATDGDDRTLDLQTERPWNPWWKHGREGGKKWTPEVRHRFHTTTTHGQSGRNTRSSSTTSSSSTHSSTTPSTSTYSTKTSTVYTPQTTIFSEISTHAPRWTTVFTNRAHPTRFSAIKGLPVFAQVGPDGAAVGTNPTAAPADWTVGQKAGVSQVWSAFWAVLSLAIILAVILLIVSATKIVFRFQNSTVRPRWSFRSDEERKILGERPRHAAYESF